MSNEVINAKDLRDRTPEELVSFVQEKSEELFKLRFQHYTGQLENTARLKLVRREIARARTIIAERRLGIDVQVKAKEVDMSDSSLAATEAEDDADEQVEEEDEK